ncbi:MAG TPA: NAD(P)-binding protein, partial [Sandaracinaceae bacterium]
DPLAAWLGSRLPAPAPVERAGDREHRALVVGYGPVGRTLVRLLREHGVTPTVIELNVETVRRLRESGIDAVYGDAAQAAILERAGVRTAGSLVFSASGSPQPVVAAARELNPELTIIARATYVAESHALHASGIETVVAAEAEVALAMAERLLERLGATRDQLDRVRDELRAELAGSAAEPAGEPVRAT